MLGVMKRTIAPQSNVRDVQQVVDVVQSKRAIIPRASSENLTRSMEDAVAASTMQGQTPLLM